MDLINHINLGSNFVRPIELINRLIQTQSKLLQYTLIYIYIYIFIYLFIYIEVLGKEGCSSSGALGLNTLCRGCSSHTTLVRLLYLGGDKLETVCTGYKV